MARGAWPSWAEGWSQGAHLHHGSVAGFPVSGGSRGPVVGGPGGTLGALWVPAAGWWRQRRSASGGGWAGPPAPPVWGVSLALWGCRPLPPRVLGPAWCPAASAAPWSWGLGAPAVLGCHTAPLPPQGWPWTLVMVFINALGGFKYTHACSTLQLRDASQRTDGITPKGPTCFSNLPHRAGNSSPLSGFPPPPRLSHFWCSV